MVIPVLKKLKRMLRVLLCVGGLIFSLPGTAFAFGFGTMSVVSRLGEPLLATIQLSTDNQQERDTLKISLASPEAYAEIGAEYPALDDLKLELVGSGANIHLRVTSWTPFEQTYLNLLLRAEWKGGKAVRQYTLLMDGSAPPEVAPVEIEAEEETPQPETDRQITVQPGDTLSEIVQRLQLPPSVRHAQRLVALLRANPQAFIDGNVNWVLSGAVLEIPSVEDMAEVELAAARQLVRTQHELWREQVARLSAAEGEGTRLVLQDAELSSPAPSEEALAEAEAAVKAATEAKAEAEARLAEAQSQVDTLQGNLSAAKQTNQQLVNRLAQLREELVKAADRIIRLEQERAENADDETPAETTQETQPTPPTQTESESETTEASATGDGESASTAPQADTPANTEASPSAIDVMAARAVNLFAAGYRWVDDRLMVIYRHPVVVNVMAATSRYRIEAFIGILLVLLGFYVAFNVRRSAPRKKALRDEGRVADTPPPSAARLAQTADADLAFGRKVDEPGINTVELLTEAETYLFYDRPDQARDMLAAAWRDHPKRYELAVKLLEIHYQQNELSEFETLLSQLREVMPEESPYWFDVDRIVQQPRKADTAAPPPPAVPTQPKPEPAAAEPPKPEPAAVAAPPKLEPKPATGEENPAIQLLQLEKHVRDNDLPAFEHLSTALLAKINLPEDAKIAERVMELRTQLGKPQAPPAVPVKDQPAAVPPQAPPAAPAKDQPAAVPPQAPPAAPAKDQPAAVPPQAPQAAPAKDQPAAVPPQAPPAAPVKDQPAAVPPQAPPAAPAKPQPAAAPQAAPAKPAKDDSQLDVAAMVGANTNVLALAKVYMEMEEMDIAKQFLMQASQHGTPEQREEADRLLKWWDKA